MKKVLLIALVLVIFLFLFYGGGRQRQFEFAQSPENIVRIEIISTSQYYSTSQEELKQLEPIFTIEREQWADFLDGFREIPCFAYFDDPAQMTLGNAIRITYRDEMMEIICEYSTLYLKPDGTDHYPPYYFDSAAYEAFIKHWWP